MMVKAQTVIDFIRMIDTTYQPYQEGEHWANDSLIDIKNAYDIRYVLPRYGTKIMVHLDFCDHFDPDINLEISEEDYNIIENGTVPITLSYDKEYKQFVK